MDEQKVVPIRPTTIKVSDYEAKQICLTQERCQYVAKKEKIPLENMKAELAQLDWLIKKETAAFHESELKILNATRTGDFEEKPILPKFIFRSLQLTVCLGTAIFDAKVLGNSGFSSLESWAIGIAIALGTFFMMEYAGRIFRQKDRKTERHTQVAAIVAIAATVALVYTAADIRTKSTVEAENKKAQQIKLEIPSDAAMSEGAAVAQNELPVNFINYFLIGLGLSAGQLLLAFFVSQPKHEFENWVKTREASKRNLKKMNGRRTNIAKKYQPLWSRTHHTIQLEMEHCLALLYGYRQGVRMGWRGETTPTFLKTEIPISVFRHPKLPPQIVDDPNLHQANVMAAFKSSSK